jgi:ubiquinone/menaquinone biosynthesis C-methylase UbiE
MTGHLAERFDRVIAVDVSPGMLERARKAVGASNVEFDLVSGSRLDPVGDGVGTVLLCYLVLQHLPGRDVIGSYLHEFARVLAPAGRAFVQLPVLGPGLRPRAWRLARRIAVPALGTFRRELATRPEYRGFRLTEPELARALSAAGLRVTARDESPSSPYRYSREVFLRLEKAASARLQPGSASAS